jgi:vacuolar protein sorting-associated protein 54
VTFRLVADAQFFKARIGKIEGAGDLGDDIVKVVEAKTVLNAPASVPTPAAVPAAVPTVSGEQNGDETSSQEEAKEEPPTAAGAAPDQDKEEAKA